MFFIYLQPGAHVDLPEGLPEATLVSAAPASPSSAERMEAMRAVAEYQKAFYESPSAEAVLDEIDEQAADFEEASSESKTLRESLSLLFRGKLNLFGFILSFFKSKNEHELVAATVGDSDLAMTAALTDHEFARTQPAAIGRRFLLLATRTEAEYRMSLKGFEQTQVAAAREMRPRPGETLRNVLARFFSGEKTPTRADLERADLQLETMRSLGLPAVEGALPAGVYLYFSSEGLLLDVSEQSRPLAEVTRSVCRNTGDGKEQPDSEQNRLEFMEKSLRPGDFILVNWLNSGIAGRMFHNAIVNEQGGLLMTHAMVYMGDGQVLHTTGDGVHEESLKAVMGPDCTTGEYITLRNPLYEESGVDGAVARFMQALRTRRGEAYGTQKILPAALGLPVGGSRSGSEVCTSIVSWALNETLGSPVYFPDKPVPTPADFFRTFDPIQAGRVRF